MSLVKKQGLQFIKRLKQFMFACKSSMQLHVFQTFVLFISDTAAENDFKIVNATVLWRNNAGCFRIVIVDDSDPEPAENFTINFVVNRTQPECINISVNQSKTVITIQENDRKSHCCSSGINNCLFPCFYWHSILHQESNSVPLNGSRVGGDQLVW